MKPTASDCSLVRVNAALRRWIPALLLATVAATPRGAARRTTVHRPVARDSVTVLAGGCYWGVESVFRHVRGVRSVTSGFAMPVATTPQGTRPAGAAPAEAVRIVYDPSQISYRHILDVFFTVAHDPTQLGRQGPDVGAEYRSIVFVATDAQRRLVRGYVDSLRSARVFPRPIVTEIDSLQGFEVVPESEQNYAAKHPQAPYIVINDAPKIRALSHVFPALYVAR